LSGEQSVSGPRLLSCQQERGCQESEMTSASRIKRKWHHRARMSRGRNVREKKMPRQAASKRKVCEDAEMSGASQIKRQWQHETKMSRIQKRQGQRFPRDYAVDGCASQAVRGRSYRLSLVFIGSSPPRNFRHPACPGSTCMMGI